MIEIDNNKVKEFIDNVEGFMQEINLFINGATIKNIKERDISQPITLAILQEQINLTIDTYKKTQKEKFENASFMVHKIYNELVDCVEGINVKIEKDGH